MVSFTPFRPAFRHVLALRHHLNISKAARSIGLTQPQLTKSLQALEFELGFKVFERTNRGLVVTEAGENFLGSLNALAQAWSGGFADSVGATGIFRLGCHSLIGNEFIPEILKILSLEFPRLQIKFKELPSRSVPDELLSGHLELGIAANPSRHAGLFCRQIAQHEVNVYSAGENKDLLIVNPQIVSFSRFVKQSKYKRVLEVDNYEIAADVAQQLRCHCLLPSPAVRSRTVFKKIKTLDRVSIEVIFRVSQRTSPAIRFLMDRWVPLIRSSGMDSGR